jgi:hypothetical protein
MAKRSNQMRIKILLHSWFWCVLGALPSFGATFTITVTPASTGFPDANPRTVPLISASSVVAVRVRVQKASSSQLWSVSALANGDLVSGASTIPISSIRWTATQDFSAGTPLGFCNCSNGTLSKLMPQVLISGRASTNNYPGCATSFVLTNSWSYNPGSYSQTVTFTASSP